MCVKYMQIRPTEWIEGKWDSDMQTGVNYHKRELSCVTQCPADKLWEANAAYFSTEKKDAHAF